MLDEDVPKSGMELECSRIQCSCCGLLLRPTGFKGQYTRRGYFSVLTGLKADSEERFWDLCRHFAATQDVHNELYESLGSSGRNGVQRYVISII